MKLQSHIGRVIFSKKDPLIIRLSVSLTSIVSFSHHVNERAPLSLTFGAVAPRPRRYSNEGKQKKSRFPFPERGDSKKEVFQPHLPVRLPCYDLAPVTSFALGRSLRSRTSGTPGFHGLTGGVYKARERIHRAMADARLLANPASWSRVADSSPN